MRLLKVSGPTAGVKLIRSVINIPPLVVVSGHSHFSSNQDINSLHFCLDNNQGAAEKQKTSSGFLLKLVLCSLLVALHISINKCWFVIRLNRIAASRDGFEKEEKEGAPNGQKRLGEVIYALHHLQQLCGQRCAAARSYHRCGA